MNLSISRDGVEIGEWTEEEVRAFYKEGQLLPTDHYWREGMTEWAELSKMIKPPPPVTDSTNKPVAAAPAEGKQPKPKKKLFPSKPPSFLDIGLPFLLAFIIGIVQNIHEGHSDIPSLIGGGLGVAVALSLVPILFSLCFVNPVRLIISLGGIALLELLILSNP